MPKQQPRPRQDLVEGHIQHHGHFAFLLAEDSEKEDVLLKGPGLRLAMNGDRVAVRLLGESRGRQVGEVVRVVARSRKTIVGVLHGRQGRWIAVPEESDEKDAVDILSFDKGLAPREGEVVVVRVTRWPDQNRRAGWIVQEMLGPARKPGVRSLAVLRTRELPDSFPPAVLEESRRFPDAVSPDMWKGRKTVFDVPVFTIDGADAKDFDDAVSLEPLGSGRMRLGVHIADVSNYVKKGSPLDIEAQERATSVYMADRVVPMLPPKLSERLCSLMPEVERLTISCFIDFGAKGEIHGARFEESVIRSWRRFTYEEVEDLLTGRHVERVHPKVKETVLRMGALAKILYQRRIRRGSLDFTLPEYKVVVGPDGAPLRVDKRPRLDSHRLIEEFMLAANEAAARALKAAKAPMLHRIHETPDPAKLQLLARELEKLGLHAPTSMASSPTAALQELLRRAAGHPLEETVSALTVRSLRQAVYSAEPDIHFGLGSEAYTHFTSPIRRYPDLMIHRALRELLQNVKSQGKPRHWQYAEGIDMERLAARCSERERLATEAERQSVDILRAELFRGRVGGSFPGIVVRSSGSGIFVALPDTGAVGLVRGASASLGSSVRVRLDRVHEGKGELDFSLLGGGNDSRPNPAQRPPRASGNRNGRRSRRFR